MKSKKEQKTIQSIDRIVLLGAGHHIATPDMREITRGSTFLYEKEHKLQNILLEAFAEMTFVVNQFQLAHEDLLAHGTQELEVYLKEINKAKPPTAANFILELHAFDLSTYFKSFLFFSRAVLDKVVPLFSYRFYDTLNTFGDQGKRFIKRVRKNKHVLNKADFIELIEKAKAKWLDSLIDLRDQYAHYSSLKEYKSFWIPGEWLGKRKISGIEEFYRPRVEIAGNSLDALDYMLFIRDEMVQFLRNFLLLCEFTPDRRPRHYLSCEECGFTFAKKIRSGTKKGQILITLPQLAIRVKDQDRDYGLIICPKCGGKTDTDLQFWKDAGMSFSPSDPNTFLNGA